MALRSALINVMTRAAEKAGRALVRDFGEVEQLQVSRKGPANFVTNADHKSEKLLVEELGRARPEFGFLLEEGGVIGEGKSERWIVDPLDGTLNFMHGLPFWSISIAAEREGEVIAGIVYEPVSDQMFWAEKGVGAFVNHQRLRVSSRTDLDDAMLAFSGAPRRVAPEDRALIDVLHQKTAGARRLGSCALNLAFVAAGRFDGFWGKSMNPWDTAAGILMVREAGGQITAVDGAANLLLADSLVASNYHLHKSLVNIVRDGAKSAA